MSENLNNQRENKGKTILVVDDSPIMRNMLSDIFTDEGYLVETAVDGEIGLTKALENDYDIIISDVHMPHKNGFELVRDLMVSKPKSKVIITDSFPDKLAANAQKEGAVCCLQKPFDMIEIRKVVIS